MESFGSNFENIVTMRQLFSDETDEFIASHCELLNKNIFIILNASSIRSMTDLLLCVVRYPCKSYASPSTELEIEMQKIIHFINFN